MISYPWKLRFLVITIYLIIPENDLIPMNIGILKITILIWIQKETYTHEQYDFYFSVSCIVFVKGDQSKEKGLHFNKTIIIWHL